MNMKRVSPSFQVISREMWGKEPGGEHLNEVMIKCMMLWLQKYDLENVRESMAMVKYSEG